MRCAICDDQKFERNIIKSHIIRFENENNIECVIDEFDCAETLLKSMPNINAYDVVFMDIYMRELNGFEASKQIYNHGYPGCIIFTTNSRDFAIESYSVAAYGYIVKPCSYETFNQTMIRAKKHWENSRKQLTVKSDHIEFCFYYKDIQWIETLGKGCMIYVKGDTIPSSSSIGSLEDILCLEDNFFRVGKSYILNHEYIRNYDSEFIYLKNEQKIPIPIRNKAQIKKCINDYRFLHM